jgi:regulatory protein
MAGALPPRGTHAERSRSAATPLDVAARLLTRAARTEAELEARLVAMGYRAATAAATVARCRDLGWVGDDAFARERARSLRQRGAGSLKIAADLAARGLADGVVAAAVEASCEGLSERDWARRALARAGSPAGARAWRLLASRGFPEDVVEEVAGASE